MPREVPAPSALVASSGATPSPCRPWPHSWMVPNMLVLSRLGWKRVVSLPSAAPSVVENGWADTSRRPVRDENPSAASR